MRPLEAAVRADGEISRDGLPTAQNVALSILELADVLGMSLHLFRPVPQAITQSIGRYPDDGGPYSVGSWPDPILPMQPQPPPSV